MNTRLREAVTGPFRLSLTPGQQRALIAVHESTVPASWPPELGPLVNRGLVMRYGDTLTATVAGLHVIGLLKEAGLYDQAKSEPAASDSGLLIP